MLLIAEALVFGLVLSSGKALKFDWFCRPFMLTEHEHARCR